jgi:hypothetical protein
MKEQVPQVMVEDFVFVSPQPGKTLLFVSRAEYSPNYRHLSVRDRGRVNRDFDRVLSGL